MTDMFDDNQDEDTEDPIIPADEDETTPTTAAEDFFSDQAEALPDPAQTITVQTSSGGKAYVATNIPLTVQAIMDKAGVKFVVGTEFYLNGTKIELGTQVPPAQCLMVVQSVKGG